MTRGNKVNIEEYIANIEEYLKEGCSLHEACLHGLTPYRTVKDYYDNDEDIRKKIDRLQNTPVLLARRSVNQHMLDDGKLAFDYLKNKKSDEFKTKETKEVTGEDGKPIDIRTISSTSEWISGLLGSGKKDTSKTSS